MIVSTLCRVYESDELSKTLIRLFHAEGQALRLLMQLIYRDLKATSKFCINLVMLEVPKILYLELIQWLQRQHGWSTKLLLLTSCRNYLKMIASDYLRNTLVHLGLILDNVY